MGNSGDKKGDFQKHPVLKGLIGIILLENKRNCKLHKV
jgi:hypothetical protein